MSYKFDVVKHLTERGVGLAEAQLVAQLRAAGIPVIAVGPDDHPRVPWTKVHEPKDGNLQLFQPGDGLLMLGGHGIDIVDEDSKKPGYTIANLPPFVTFGVTRTPSGGRHYVVRSTGLAGGELPGVGDYCGGKPDGSGRKGAFLPGSKRTKYPDGGYTIEVPWDVELCLRCVPDQELAEAVMEARATSAATHEPGEVVPCNCDEWLEDTPNPYHRSIVRGELAKLEELELLGWAGPGWDNTCFAVAMRLQEVAACQGSGYSHDRLLGDYLQTAPQDEGWSDDELMDKWRSAEARQQFTGKSACAPVEGADSDFEVLGDVWPDIPKWFDDARLAAWFGWQGLGGNWRWSKGLGWVSWDGRRWVPRVDEEAVEAVRLAAVDVYTLAVKRGVVGAKLAELKKLLTTRRIKDLAALARGVLSVNPALFDAHPDLLNVGNGVVDLRTGRLQEHDRGLLLTRITDTDYVAGAVHEDWEQVLSCMDEPVRDWMQVRFGQAATGWPTSDDVLPIGQGGGSNGKSTLLAGLFTALGDHITLVPEKLLRASPNDHPTELMSLRGVRVAVIDETPEAGVLNVPRLKAMLGTTMMTARSVFKDNVTWRATHSLFVMTNYKPNVAETDHGTWRRLAMVVFDRKFKRDDRFRDRVMRGKDGIAEAALYWVVTGARRWYANERVLPTAPDRVVADTRDWRGDSDLIMAYVDDRLVFDPECTVLSSDLLEDFNDWLRVAGQSQWSAKLFASRFGSHDVVTGNGVIKRRGWAGQRLVRSEQSLGPASEDQRVWSGIRWRRAGDS